MNRYRLFLALLFGIASSALVVTGEKDRLLVRGGTTATAAVPWYAVFVDTTLCGGVQVAQDIIVTTASCIDDGKIPDFVRVGSLNRGSGGTVSAVVQTSIHPDWTGDVVLGNDIAVMRVGDNLQDATFPTLNKLGNSPEVNDKLNVVGFGQMDDFTFSDTLQTLTYSYDENCTQRFDEYNPTVHLCADATPSQGACGGDGGSPAVLSETSTVVGLSSFSDGLCSSQTFDVYTRISLYEEWIQAQICYMSKFRPSSCSSSCALFSFSSFAAFGNSVAGFFGI